MSPEGTSQARNKHHVLHDTTPNASSRSNQFADVGLFYASLDHNNVHNHSGRSMGCPLASIHAILRISTLCSYCHCIYIHLASMCVQRLTLERGPLGHECRSSRPACKPHVSQTCLWTRFGIQYISMIHMGMIYDYSPTTQVELSVCNIH